MALGLSVPSGDVSRGGGADAINPAPRGEEGEPSGLWGGSATSEGRSGPREKKKKPKTPKISPERWKRGDMDRVRAEGGRKPRVRTQRGL